jgi:hypothetical protein
MSSLRRRLYKAIVRIHPADFRDEFGREMMLDFEDAVHTYGLGCLWRDGLFDGPVQQQRPPRPQRAPSKCRCWPASSAAIPGTVPSSTTPASPATSTSRTSLGRRWRRQRTRCSLAHRRAGKDARHQACSRQGCHRGSRHRSHREAFRELRTDGFDPWRRNRRNWVCAESLLSRRWAYLRLRGRWRLGLCAWFRCMRRFCMRAGGCLRLRW